MLPWTLACSCEPAPWWEDQLHWTLSPNDMRRLLMVCCFGGFAAAERYSLI